MVLDILAVLIRLARHSLESAVRVRGEEGEQMDKQPCGLFLFYFMVFCY